MIKYSNFGRLVFNNRLEIFRNLRQENCQSSITNSSLLKLIKPRVRTQKQTSRRKLVSS